MSGWQVKLRDPLPITGHIWASLAMDSSHNTALYKCRLLYSYSYSSDKGRRTDCPVLCCSSDIIRPRRSRSAAAYSHQTFPCMICRSVCLSVQRIVEKRQIAAGSRLAPYVGRVHGWGRYWGLAIGLPEGVLLGVNLDRTIVTNGDFTAYVWDSASTVGAAVSGGACDGPRHCCIRWRST